MLCGMKETPDMLFRSRYVSYFAQHGEIYAYHDRFGYLLGMSPDLAELLEFFAGDLRTRDEVDAEWGEHFEREQLDEFLMVFKLYSCLIESELAEERQLWSMVPVRSRWVVYHQPSDRELTFWHTSRDGVTAPDPVPAWAARAWALMDGETLLETIWEQIADDASLADEARPRSVVLETLGSWVHHSRQYLKFAKAPLSRFGPEHQWPSYLRSTMPFAPWRPGKDPLPDSPMARVATPIAPPHGYYTDGIEDAERQFREVETTLSHLFRNPHPLLGGLSYADRITDDLVRRGMLHAETRDILEVGAGLGHFAAGVLARLRDHHPAIFDGLSYTIFDLSPALRAAQQERLTAAGLADRVTWQAGNAETLDRPDASADLILCNEVIGDFTTVKLTRELVGLADEIEPEKAYARLDEATMQRLGDAGELLRTYVLPLRDAPEEFFLNVGAMRFLERVHAVLRPGGAAFVTEYGEPARYPVPSTQLDHLEFSIHFGPLEHVARQLGLQVQLEYVQDLIALDRDAKTLETTRTYFASLAGMLDHFGAHLDKSATSREMFLELIDGKVPLDHIGDVRFRVVDERCMGLAPHEFKALLLRKA